MELNLAKQLGDIKNTPGNDLPFSHRMKADICYNCKKQGHWATYCPDKSKIKSEPSSVGPTIVDDQAIPIIQCKCGGGTCVVKTSWTSKNPGRKFYKCPGEPGRNCQFFKWCDMETSYKRPDVPESSYLTSNQRLDVPESSYPTSNQRLDVPESSYPTCDCGAGMCSLFTVKKEGRNRGRKFFVCPVKKGQGACNFFQWQDIPGNATSDGSVDEKEGDTTKHNEVDDALLPQANDDADKNGDGIDDAMIPPIGNLRLGKETIVGGIAKTEKCFRCGNEGHWVKDCTRPSSSLCFKCGKVGHCVKQCTN